MNIAPSEWSWPDFHRILQQSQTTLYLFTLIQVSGSAPQRVGSKMLIDSLGQRLLGTIGGGALELFLLKLPGHQKSTQDFQEISLDLKKDLGMLCGGRVKILLELVNWAPSLQIVVFGAGHIAQELIPLLLRFPAQVTCVDSRTDWLSQLLQGQLFLRTVCTEDPVSILPTLHPSSCLLIMNRNHLLDFSVLKTALMEYDFPFVGTIGSQEKAKKFRTQLLTTKGFPSKALRRWHCPLGLDLGKSKSVFSIALSIAAQMHKWSHSKEFSL